MLRGPLQIVVVVVTAGATTEDEANVNAGNGVKRRPSNFLTRKAQHPKLLFPSNVHDVHDRHPLLLLCTSVL